MAETAEETGGGGYSPLLAQMMRIDPEKIGSVSLSALGRQAMGSESDSYRAAKAEVDAARESMKAALTDRKNRVDPSMLALAQGFLAPTRTGSFGESLGTAVGAYGKAQETEGQRAAELAKMRYELANTALKDEQDAARLGLSVVSKLSPQMTAFQKQVLSEGIEPRSPEGIARLKELLAVDKATPEMKTFAAQAGLRLTDPTFATRYDTFLKTKGLQDIATRLNLDLNKPEDLKRAQQEAQRNEFIKENKLLADALQSFGGDSLNPMDLKKAQGIVDENLRLEQTGKRTTIASQNQTMSVQRQQMIRTKQEIDEHVRNNDLGAVAAKAQEAGIPLDPKSQFAGLNPKEAATKREAEFRAASDYIKTKVGPFVQGIDTDIQQLERAQALNKKITTGSVLYDIPGVGNVAKRLSGERDLISEFDSLSALAAKQNRIPGDSNVSNLDVKMMQLGTFSSDKEPSTNTRIIEYQLEQRKRDRDFNSYLSNYAAVNGAITPHAQAMWRKYLDANPITVRDAKGGVQLNPSRVTYQQYFSMPRVQVDAQGRETQR